MKEVTVTGKSVEDAVAEALQLLGASRSQVEVEVLNEGTKGLFGLLGNKMARVRVLLREEEAPAPEVSIPEGSTRKPAPDREERTDRARNFLSRFCKILDVEAEITQEEGAEGAVNLEVNGPDLGILIGRHGQTLDALQYLLNLSANKGGKGGQDWVRFVLDVEGYRRRREETLQGLARRLATKVKVYGRKSVLEPMTPQERRIIHTALQDDPDVYTYSEGEEPFRRVIISLREKTGKTK